MRHRGACQESACHPARLPAAVQAIPGRAPRVTVSFCTTGLLKSNRPRRRQGPNAQSLLLLRLYWRGHYCRDGNLRQICLLRFDLRRRLVQLHAHLPEYVALLLEPVLERLQDRLFLLLQLGLRPPDVREALDELVDVLRLGARRCRTRHWSERREVRRPAGICPAGGRLTTA